MKPILMASALLALFCDTVQCQEREASGKPLSATVTSVSDYLFRGLTQTWGQPAIQASLDYNAPSGFFASAWVSNVDSRIYAGGNSEIDLTVGFRKEIFPEVGVSTSLLGVAYPQANYRHVRNGSANPDQKYDFAELDLGVTYRWLSLKLGYALTDLMGFNRKTGFTGSTRGSLYADLSLDVPLSPDCSFGAHVGRSALAAQLAAPTPGGTRNGDFNDFRFSLTHRLPDGWAASLLYTWNGNRAFFDRTASNDNASELRDMGRKSLSLSVAKTF